MSETDSPILIITTVLCLYGVGYENVVEFDRYLVKPEASPVNGITHLTIGGGRYVFIHNLMAQKSICFYDPIFNRNIEMISNEFVKLCSDLLLTTSQFVNVSDLTEIEL